MTVSLAVSLIYQQCLSSEQISSRASEVQWLSCFKPSKEHFSVHPHLGSFYCTNAPQKLLLVTLHFHQQVQTLFELYHE